MQKVSRLHIAWVYRGNTVPLYTHARERRIRRNETQSESYRTRYQAVP